MADEEICGVVGSLEQRVQPNVVAGLSRVALRAVRGRGLGETRKHIFRRGRCEKPTASADEAPTAAQEIVVAIGRDSRCEDATPESHLPCFDGVLHRGSRPSQELNG